MEYIKNNEITTEQKKKFFQFMLDIYSEKIEIRFDNVDLKSRGFCWSYFYFFGETQHNFELLPELRKHKPKKHFYYSDGSKTNDYSQFWFPINENKKRIKLCEKILKKL